MKKYMGIMMAILFAAAPALASPPPPGLCVTDMIGDNDGYGYGAAAVPDGADLPYTDDPVIGKGWLFDNRSAAELAASDGAQETDWRPPGHPFGLPFPPREALFYHSFSAAQFALITSATYYLDVSGILDVSLSRLYFDGVEVAGAFAGVNQGTWGSGIFAFAVPLATIADGALDVHFVGGLGNNAIAFDFSKLKVCGEPIPEPATLLLLGGGLLSAAMVRRRRNRT